MYKLCVENFSLDNEFRIITLSNRFNIISS